jgi:hypothetical protein
MPIIARARATCLLILLIPALRARPSTEVVDAFVRRQSSKGSRASSRSKARVRGRRPGPVTETFTRYDPLPCSGSSACVNGSHGSATDWSAYLRAVYGEHGVPISTRDAFSWFYSCVPSAAANLSCAAVPRAAPIHVEPLKLKLWSQVGLHTAFRGDRANTDGLFLAGRYGFFVKRTPVNTAAASLGWVEVIRGRKLDETIFNSTWYYVVKGSGVWLNVGRTVAMAIGMRKKLQRMQVAEARSDGYDTLQYPNSWSMGMHEIVDLRPAARQEERGVSTCGSAELRTGWRHQLPCHCDDGAELINCAGGRHRRRATEATSASGDGDRSRGLLTDRYVPNSLAMAVAHS